MERAPATVEQYEEMIGLADANGYPDWVGAAADVLRRRAPELEDGLTTQDADTVIRALGGGQSRSHDSSDSTDKGVVRGNRDRAWAIGTGGVTVGVWVMLPGTIVALAWTVLAVFMCAMWIGNWFPDRE